MNRSIVAIILASLVSTSAFALTDANNYNFTGDINFDTPPLIENQRMTNTAARLNQAGISAYTAQSDTNATTTTTNYLPRYVGDILLGNVGGTQTVFTAFAATVNGWVAALPFPNPIPSITAGIADITTNANVAGATTTATLKVTGSATVGNSLTVNTNLTVSGRITETTISQATISTNLVVSGRVTGGLTINDATVSTNLTVSGRITAVTISQATISTNLSAVGIAASGYVTDKGNRVVVGDTTNTLLVQSGIWTNGGTTVFPIVFSAAPVVGLTYTAAPGTNLAVVATADRTNFTTIGVTAEGTYIAIGTK